MAKRYKPTEYDVSMGRADPEDIIPDEPTDHQLAIEADERQADEIRREVAKINADAEIAAEESDDEESEKKAKSTAKSDGKKKG